MQILEEEKKHVDGKGKMKIVGERDTRERD